MSVPAKEVTLLERIKQWYAQQYQPFIIQLNAEVTGALSAGIRIILVVNILVVTLAVLVLVIYLFLKHWHK